MLYSVRIRDTNYYYAEVEAKDIPDLKSKVGSVIDSFDYDNYEQGEVDIDDVRVGSLQATFGKAKVYKLV
jgi:hypothetical protein